MTIIRRGNSWGFDNRNAFINHDGTNSWCEDDKGFVYSFGALASGRDKSAPSHMRRLARQVAKDLKEEVGL